MHFCDFQKRQDYQKPLLYIFSPVQFRIISIVLNLTEFIAFQSYLQGHKRNQSKKTSRFLEQNVCAFEEHTWVNFFCESIANVLQVRKRRVMIFRNHWPTAVCYWNAMFYLSYIINFWFKRTTQFGIALAQSPSCCLESKKQKTCWEILRRIYLYEGRHLAQKSRAEIGFSKVSQRFLLAHVQQRNSSFVRRWSNPRELNVQNHSMDQASCISKQLRIRTLLLDVMRRKTQTLKLWC